MWRSTVAAGWLRTSHQAYVDLGSFGASGERGQDTKQVITVAASHPALITQELCANFAETGFAEAQRQTIYPTALPTQWSNWFRCWRGGAQEHTKPL